MCLSSLLWLVVIDVSDWIWDVGVYVLLFISSWILRLGDNRCLWSEYLEGRRDDRRERMSVLD